MDINQAKLERVKTFLADCGTPSPASIAQILKAQPKNLSYLRGYVEAASKELGDPSYLQDFDVAASLGEEAEAPPSASPPPAPPKATTAVPSVPAEAYLLDENNLMTPLEFVRVSGGRTIYRPAKVTQKVEILLRGQKVVVDLLDLEPVTVGGETFPVATLEIIATAAAL